MTSVSSRWQRTGSWRRFRWAAAPAGIQGPPGGKRVYVATSDSVVQREGTADGIAVIDVAARRMIARFRAGSDPEQFAVTPDGSRIYASNEDGGTATAIDARSGKRLASLVVGIEPEGVAVSPDGRWVVVTSETSNTLSVIDTRAGKVVDNLLLDLRPRAAAFTPDGSRLFATAEVGGTLTAIDAGTHEILATIPVAGGESKPVGVAVTPDSRRVVVVAGHTNAVVII